MKKEIKEIQEFINMTSRTEEEVKQGALLLLTLNRDKFYYDRACRAPRFYEKNIEYKLGQWLRMLLDGVTTLQVMQMVKTEAPKARQIIEEARVVEDETHIATSVVKRGRREDHDSLPAHVKKYWEDCAGLYKQIKEQFNTLVNLSAAKPCERYDHVKLLMEYDKKYRKLMQRYDDYKPGDTEEKPKAKRKVAAKTAE